MEELKMYCLNPNDWGEVWYTIAPDPESALNNIKNLFKRKMEENIIKRKTENNFYHDYIIKKYSKWESATLDKLPKDYTLDEYKNGDVIEAEFA